MARRAMRSLESEVLAALWAADGALTTAQVLAELDSGLAYTTVQTVLTRLVGKGAVERDASGRAHTYRPVLDDAGLAAHRMRTILDGGGDHDAVLLRFLGTLSPAERSTAARLLRRRPGS